MRTDKNKRALFALNSEPRIEGDTVYRTGKFFEVGQEFIDMNGRAFSISESEADAKLPAFMGGKLNVEHMPTIFDGKLGDVTRTWREGKDVMAEYAIPRWLHEATGGEPLKISSEWDIPTKTPLGAAIVLNPAVSDAVMMAAFKASPHLMGISPEVQAHHDHAVRSGAECDGKAMFAETAAFMTPDALQLHQEIHDMIRDKTGGKCCDVYKTRSTMYYAAPTPSGSAGKGLAMFEKLKALFRSTGKPEAEIDAAIAELQVAASNAPAPTPATTTTAQFADSAEYRALMSTVNAQNQLIANMQAEFAAQQNEAKFAAADAELTRLVSERRVTPSEAEGNAEKNIPGYRQLIRSNYAAFAATLPMLQNRPPMFQGDRAVAIRPTLQTDPTVQLGMMAAKMSKETGKPLAECAKFVAAQNPELVARHQNNRPVVKQEEGGTN